MAKPKIILEDCLFYQPALNTNAQPYCDMVEKNISCCNGCKYYINYKDVKNRVKEGTGSKRNW